MWGDPNKVSFRNTDMTLITAHGMVNGMVFNHSQPKQKEFLS